MVTRVEYQEDYLWGEGQGQIAMAYDEKREECGPTVGGRGAYRVERKKPYSGRVNSITLY